MRSDDNTRSAVDQDAYLPSKDARLSRQEPVSKGKFSVRGSLRRASCSVTGVVIRSNGRDSVSPPPFAAPTYPATRSVVSPAG